MPMGTASMSPSMSEAATSQMVGIETLPVGGPPLENDRKSMAYLVLMAW